MGNEKMELGFLPPFKTLDQKCTKE